MRSRAQREQKIPYTLNILNFKKDFALEDELFNIIEINNNKVHSKTKQIPKVIRDLYDNEQINLI